MARKNSRVQKGKPFRTLLFCSEKPYFCKHTTKFAIKQYQISSVHSIELSRLTFPERLTFLQRWNCKFLCGGNMNLTCMGGDYLLKFSNEFFITMGKYRFSDRRERNHE